MTSATLESLLEGAVHNLRTEQSSSAAEPAREAEPPKVDPVENAAAAETGATKDGPPPSHEDEPTDADGRLKALIGERKKRQEKEHEVSERDERIAELQKRLETLEGRGKPQPQQPQAREPAAAPDPWLDPEGFARHIAAENDNTNFLNRVELSQELMRSKHNDYDDVEKVFREECKTNPFLARQLRESPIPAKFAYEQGRRLMALREIGDDPAAYKAKIEADLKAKLESEQAAKPPVQAPAVSTPAPQQHQPPPPPPSLAGVTSSAPRKATAKFEGPTPLDAILR